jgi:hypothetical protein
MNKNILEVLAWFLFGAVVTIIIYPREEQESTFEVVTEVKTDTVYTEIVDTVYIPKKEIKTQVLRDTVLVISPLLARLRLHSHLSMEVLRLVEKSWEKCLK